MAGINAGYAVFQLSRALTASDLNTEAKTHERIERWQQVVEHMVQGTALYGSRTPLVDVPEWVTLEVVTGGFATGQYLAGGALTEYERRLAASIPGIRPGFERLDLNIWHLTDEGVEALQKQLVNSDYRVDVPEEAALLYVAWLLGQQRTEDARKLIVSIAPFFEQLRFFPMASDGLPLAAAEVHIFDVGDIKKLLSKLPAQQRLAVQKHVVTTRLTLYDAAISLFLLTYEDDWPCQQYPEGWLEQANALNSQFDATSNNDILNVEHFRDRVGELYALLRLCSRDPASLTGRQVGRIRRIVNDFVCKHGHPESEHHLQYREIQHRQVAAPEHHLIAKVVSERLTSYSSSEGISDFSSLLEPVTGEEAKAYSLITGVAIPPAVRRRLERCRKGTITELIDKGLITSGDTVARVLPAMTAEICSAGFRDTTLRMLSVATYRAFRRRRSLLLLNLQSQVKISELPWVAAVESEREAHALSVEGARQALIESSATTLSAFPQAILPNKLLQEFGSLAATAKLDLPFVEEVAVDIFMGTFSNKFVEAARRAASLIGGTLYAHYYDIDTNQLAILPDKPKSKSRNYFQRDLDTSDALANLCAQRANAPLGAWHSATNGRIIEQQQILTTQNLSLLFGELGLKALLHRHLGSLAQQCFQWICIRLQMKIKFYHSSLVMLKNTAYAWRQMVFYLSMLDDAERRCAIDSMEEHFAAQPTVFRERFLPAIIGLRVAAAGLPLTLNRQKSEGARVFLGWTTERHWLLPPQTNDLR
ncbi:MULTISPECIES: hypothetical protein [unclassified Pseudomonas]|uniref:hypothetical protein n=1 Tax=unclassified Pseudomonas TaxID=196821 RepID=UPI001B31E9BD|nr:MULTISPECIES: hypothetical protein [unclassified Pseudomonas]MBP5942850.1 hypothetical protein [Pseudomonas sp. P9(2020)]MBZ9565110.1 hypothetical protein [Pseudomonas sp. P116]